MDRLRRRIERHGSVSFRTFMAAALYDARDGYYSNLRGFGAQGDFITGPEQHPVFGALLARLAWLTWEALDRPRPFRVHEMGAGTGNLALNLIRAAQADAPDLAASLAYSVEERSPSLRAVQRETLAGLPVSWGAGQASPHLVLANELLDAFPVYRVVTRGSRLREMRVALAANGEGFTWVESPRVPAAVRAYFDRVGVLPAEGAVAEVNVSLGPWAQRLAQRMERGLAVVIDYGDTAERLFARPAGSLLTYFRHTLGSDPLIRVGHQDISTRVDFTTLAHHAVQSGLDVLGIVPQAVLLQRLGMAQYAARLPDRTNRLALGALSDPQGLGQLQALFLGRGIAAAALLPVLEGRPGWPLPTWVPTLPPDPEDDGFADLWREAFGVED